MAAKWRERPGGKDARGRRMDGWKDGDVKKKERKEEERTTRKIQEEQNEGRE